MRIAETVRIEDRQTVPLKGWRKTRWPKKRVVLLIVLLLFLLAGTTSAVVCYQAYNTYLADNTLAQTGMQHLRSGITLLKSLKAQPFAPKTVQQAEQEFTRSLSDWQAIKTSLANFSGVASIVPIYGPQLTAAMRLSALAVDLTQAGIGGCKMLEIVLPRLGAPLNASTGGLTNTDLATLSGKYQAVKASLHAAMNEAMLLQPGDVSFDVHAASLLQEFRENIPTIQTALSETDQLMLALPAVLGTGTPTNYLLEILDSTELRPGGGFIGNYGIATLSGGRLTSARITDVDLLDKPFEYAGHVIPYPPAYSWFANYLAPASWSLRDSNLDADFPTDARNAEVNFEREGGNVPLQGVIAITPFFIEHVLDITGPIAVPEYNETVTAQNLISLIHFHQLGGRAAGEGSDTIPAPGGHSSQRKRFTELLGEHLLDHVKQFSPGSRTKFVQLAISSLRTKDVQVYFNASGVENALHLLQLDGTIQSPPGDHLFLVDANVAGDKANSFITNTVRDRVTIDKNGDAIHSTSITYAWKLPGKNYGQPLYREYARIYAPPGSSLSQQNGWQPLGTSTAFGSQVWAGFFTLTYGQTRTITLDWTGHGVVKRDARGWHYQYLLQRQAGAQRSLALQVTLPSCASVTSQWGGLGSHGKQEETLTQAFTQDVDTGVDYVCT